MNELIANKGLWIAAAFVTLFALERAFPASLVRHTLPDTVKNLALAAFNFLLSPLIVIPLTAWAAQHAWNWRPEIWPNFWNGAGGLALDILLLDCWIYFWHRINHEVSFLWRFHEVHHLDETLDTTTALRFHFGEVLLSSIARACMIILLGMSLTSVVVFEVALALATLFHHSNLRLSAAIEIPLSKIIVTPSIHWVHHHAKREDTDSNYGTIFAFWDRLFASSSKTARTLSMPIGVEGVRDRDLPGLVMKPFIRR
jgi:sterol desaturase/sphingolipid hydroxylase (fatty acid hydroxylase superfamily)